MISDERGATLCTMPLTEAMMMAGGCMKLEVNAEQYGVHSQKKVYEICYDSKSTSLFAYLCWSPSNQDKFRVGTYYLSENAVR